MAYSRVNWEDAPSEKTPIDAEHLNVMDEGIEKLDKEKLKSNGGDIADTKVTFEESKELKKLESGSKTDTLFGILAAAVSRLITHIADRVGHITSEERENWNEAREEKHKHDNKEELDAVTAAYTIEEKSKLLGIEEGAEKNKVIGIKGNAESSYRTGNVNLTPENIGSLPLSGGTLPDGATLFVPYGKSLKVRCEYGESGSGVYFDSTFGGTEVNLLGGVVKVNPGSTTFSGGISAGAVSIQGNLALHKGNSAPVSIGTSAPSDKTALWIDTSA